jgi:hypothetical protein
MKVSIPVLAAALAIAGSVPLAALADHGPGHPGSTQASKETVQSPGTPGGSGGGKPGSGAGPGGSRPGQGTTTQPSLGGDSSVFGSGQGSSGGGSDACDSDDERCCREFPSAADCDDF